MQLAQAKTQFNCCHSMTRLPSNEQHSSLAWATWQPTPIATFGQCCLVRRLFMQHLPSACRANLAGRGDVTDFDALADITDGHVVSVSDTTDHDKASTLAEVQQKICTLRCKMQSHHKSMSPSAVQRSTNSSEASPSAYHAIFGNRAQV